jgi:hypothetical protein
VFETIKEATAGTITPETKMVGGVKVRTVPGVPMVTPAVAVVGDFLVVATHPDVVQSMIDTAAGGKDLGQSADYRRYVSSLPGDATVTVYVALKRLFDFGYPLLVNHVAAIEGAGPDEAEPGTSMGAVKALGSFGECLSGLGIKISGDEKGVTVSSRSRNGGLGVMSLLGAAMFVPVKRTVVEREEIVGEGAKKLIFATELRFWWGPLVTVRQEVMLGGAAGGAGSVDELVDEILGGDEDKATQSEKAVSENGQ